MGRYHIVTTMTITRG